MSNSITRPVQYIEIDNIMWPKSVTKDSLQAIKDFEIWDDDVWVSTYPKAGTHWVSEICHLVNHEGKLEDIDRQQKQTPIEFGEKHGNVAGGDSDIPSHVKAKNWKRPRVIVSHIPVEFLPRQVLDEGKGKVISVIRNPKDSIVSEFHFLKGFKPGAPETFSQCLVENGTSEKAPYKTWFGHVLGYWAKRHHKQFLVLKYEDMKRDTRGAVVQIADFLGHPLSDEVFDKITELVTLDSMKKRFYTTGETEDKEKKKAGAFNLIRKGTIGQWKTHFTVAENNAFDALYRQKLAGSGLTIQFE